MRTEEEKAKGREQLKRYREDLGRIEAIQESRDKLSRIEFALADIRDVLRGRTHPSDSYTQEKLEERDLFLTDWSKETATLAKLEKEQAIMTEYPLTGCRVIEEALDPTKNIKTYVVAIHLENDSLQDDDGNVEPFELAEILSSLADSIRSGDLDHEAIQDTNGNTVGHAEVIETGPMVTEPDHKPATDYSFKR